MAWAVRCSFSIMANRTWPSPSGPNPTPGETATTSFVVDTEGAFPYFCTEFCSALHLEMVGYMLVEPEQATQR